MSTVRYNIENFNQYLKLKVDGLKARGERTDELMINLFKAYQVVSEYNITEDKLMTSSLKNYEILHKENKWNSISL